MGLRGRDASAKRARLARFAHLGRPAWKRKRGRVARLIAFLEALPITKGILAGTKMKLLPGQRRFVEAVYGRLAADGRRQIRIAIKSEPRGGGKTGLVAGLMLAHLLGPECEPRGECYSAAYNKLQAALIFAEMKAIIEAVPEFEARCNIQRYGKVIEVLEGDGAGSVYESLSADDKRAHGLSPSFWAFDEYAQAPNSDLLDTLRTSMGKRSESLGIVISTQAANDMHPLSQLIDDAALGQDPSVYLQLAAAPIDADIFDERVWFVQRGARKVSRSERIPRSSRTGKAAHQPARKIPKSTAQYAGRCPRAIYFRRGLDDVRGAARHVVVARPAVLCRARSVANDGHECAGAVLAARRVGAAVLLAARTRLARSRSQRRGPLSDLA